MDQSQQTISSMPGGHRVCPPWVAYLFDNPLRRLLHPAEKLLGPYVKPGMHVLDFGCGFGHFALGMARLLEGSGQVVATDVQQKMLDKTMARARKAGVEQRIQPVLCRGETIGIDRPLDFILACNVMHETPDPQSILAEFHQRLKPECGLLMMEPKGHLSSAEFEAEIELAAKVGFAILDRPAIIKEMCVFLTKAPVQEV